MSTLEAPAYAPYSTRETCPACHGIECLDRPRFFAGQLLTEQELNSEQVYMLAKNRLHNRYLHGAGVVCGLELVQHECEGWVTVKSGYAIDPCGADVLVCEDYSFDVLARIAECRDLLGRRHDLPCDPVRPQSDKDCKGLKEHWCVTIAYDEREARPMTTLRREPGATTISRSAAAAQPCGCGGHSTSQPCGCGGHSNGNGGGSRYAASAPTTMTATTVQPGMGTAVACEPTRIFEGFRIDVAQEPANHCGDPKRALGTTGIASVIAMGRGVQGFLEQRVPQTAFATMKEALGGSTEAIDAGDLWQSYCYGRNAMVDLEVYQPAPTFSMRAELDAIHVSAPPPEADEEYKGTVVTAIGSLWSLLLRYIVSRGCALALPSCPPDPQDSRLVLGCLTIVDGKITHICDLSCRKYAGSFPAILHWLSFYPVIPLLGLVLERLCCGDVTKGRGFYGLRTVREPVVAREGTGAGGLAEGYAMALALHLRPLFEPANMLRAVLDPSLLEQAFALLGTSEPDE
jgi:hypothetical protein